MNEINKLYTTEEAMKVLGLDPSNKRHLYFFRKLCNKSHLGKDKIKRIKGTNMIPHSELVRISTLNT